MTNSVDGLKPTPDGGNADDDESMIGEDDDRNGCSICWVVFSEKRKPENPCTEESCRQAKQFCGPCVKQWKSAWYAEDKNLGKPFLCPNCRTGIWGPPLMPRNYRHSYPGHPRQSGVRRHPSSPVSPRSQRRRPADFQHLQYRGFVSQAARGLNTTATAHGELPFGFIPAPPSFHPAYGMPVPPAGHQRLPYYAPVHPQSTHSQPGLGYSPIHPVFRDEFQRLENMRNDRRYETDAEYRAEVTSRLISTLRANVQYIRTQPALSQPSAPEQPRMAFQQSLSQPGTIQTPPPMMHPIHPPQQSTSSYFSPFQPPPHYLPQMMPQHSQDGNDVFSYNQPPVSPQRRHFPQRRSASAQFNPPDLSAFHGGPSSPSRGPPSYPRLNQHLSVNYGRGPPSSFYHQNGLDLGNARLSGLSTQTTSNFNSDIQQSIPVLHGVSLSPQTGPPHASALHYGATPNWQGPSSSNW
jgi:hypothetical protein